MAKTGRPKIEIDWKLLDAILQYGATLKDCANMCNCSEDTIERRIKKEKGDTFAAYRTKRMTGVKFTLIQKAIEMAKNGDRTMLIFSLKNLAGWADKIDNKLSGETSIKIDIDDAKL